MNDWDLLRRYEPIIRFTQGELFFPCAVDDFIRGCSLWERYGDLDHELVPVGGLDGDELARYDEIRPGQTLFMRFVTEPLEGLAYQRWLWRRDRPVFHAPGRLARVGLVSRLLDSVFDISLLLRGKVPGGTTAAAEVWYRGLRERDPRYVYYGRVRREGGYIILHYTYFYVMNNWRSSYNGVNDHEADWEQVFVYLGEREDESPVPLWVAYATHDLSGDDLRRRWDDPELHREGDHPVIYAGAGSHASYFLPGEYMMDFKLEFLRPLFNLVQVSQRLWRGVLRQGDADKLAEQINDIFNIPFIDYARGDGFAIGPGQDSDWSPILLTDDLGWAQHYRGLWGLDTKDTFGGESAPAGPKHNRDGTVRLSWHNPLGWAGLHKVAPPAVADRTLSLYIENLEGDLSTVEDEIGHMRDQLRVQELEVRALQESDYLLHLFQRREAELEQQETALNALYEQRTELVETLAACRDYLDDVRAGERGDPQAHLHRMHAPQSESEVEQSRLIESWAAFSSGLLLLGFVAFVAIRPDGWIIWLVGMIAVFVLIEAALRGRLETMLLGVTILLAILTALVLIVQFFWWIVTVGVIGVSWLIIRENLRELRGH